MTYHQGEIPRYADPEYSWPKYAIVCIYLSIYATEDKVFEYEETKTFGSRNITAVEVKTSVQE